ncbi:hypothetical protein Hanom_Chr01g00090121 [Helianthus anomalus]
MGQVSDRNGFWADTSFCTRRVSYRFDPYRFDANRFDPYRFDVNRFNPYRFESNCFDQYRSDANSS